MNVRECDAIGCSAPVASGKFMCLPHWRRVPRPLQDQIYARYRALRRGYAFLSDLVYLNAAVAAIDGLATQDGVEGVNPYRRHLLIAQRRAAAKEAS